MYSFSQSSIDRFKKFARLGTILAISDAIASISATMRGKRTSDDLAKSIYRFKDANPDYANSAIAQIFSISESTLRGIPKRRIGKKKNQIGSKICTHKKNQASASRRVNRNPKLRLCDLLSARRLVPNVTVHRFLKKIAAFEIVLLYKTFLRMLKKIVELTGAVDISFLTSQKVFSATIN